MSLETRLSDLATRMGTEAKALRTLLNNNAGDNSSLATDIKTNIVAAINELHTELDSLAASAGAGINDASSSSTTETWSIDKITSELQQVVSDLTNGAPAALDTLDELAAALGDDANFAATVTSGLSSRVRFDAAQPLTLPQQAQARANTGSQSAAEVGDTDQNLVTIFETALT